MSVTETIKSHSISKEILIELKDMHWYAKRNTLFKSFLSLASLVASIAMVLLFSGSTFFLGTGIGLIILSTYAFYHYRHQHRHTNRLYERAKKALNQM